MGSWIHMVSRASINMPSHGILRSRIHGLINRIQRNTTIRPTQNTSLNRIRLSSDVGIGSVPNGDGAKSGDVTQRTTVTANTDRLTTPTKEKTITRQLFEPVS